MIANGDTCEERRGERGMALLCVMWTLLLVGIVATSLATEARKHGLLARNGMLLARAEAAADGGVIRGLASLLDPRPDWRWAANGSVHAFKLDGVSIGVRIIDEAGKVDVNTASPDLIAAVFRVAGAPPQRAFQIAATVVDVRSGRSTGRPHGFELPAELLGLPGVSPALFARAVPYLTVLTRVAGIDPAVAAPALLAGLGQDVQSGEAGGAAAAVLGASEQHTLFTIDASASLDGAHFVRHAIVRLTHNVTRPYLLHEWTRAQVDP